MSTTEALRFIKTLQEQGIKKQVAVEIVSFVEKQQGETATKQDVDWLKWGLGAILVFMIGGFAWTATEINGIRAETKESRQELNSRIDRIEQRNEERHKQVMEQLRRR